MAAPDHSADPAQVNRTLEPHAAHMELFDPTTGAIWLAQAPVTAARYEALEPPAPLVKSGLGLGCMDEAWFLRSPGAERDGPCETLEVDGIVLQRVARPRLGEAEKVTPDGPRRLLVEKHHVVVFHAGTTVDVLTDPEGRRYVRQTRGPEGRTLRLPDGWRLDPVALDERWQIELVSPVVTLWFGIESFQGPVELPER